MVGWREKGEGRKEEPIPLTAMRCSVRSPQQEDASWLWARCTRRIQHSIYIFLVQDLARAGDLHVESVWKAITVKHKIQHVACERSYCAYLRGDLDVISPCTNDDWGLRRLSG